MWRRRGAVLASLFFILVALGWDLLKGRQNEPGEYYVSPDGSNRNDGKLNRPWRTLRYALEMLSAGDVLYLRDGTYYEHEIKIGISGSASTPITIRSYPGERAVIDGGVPYFTTTRGSEWEIIDSNIGLYRSRRALPEEADFVRAWLVDDDVQLVEYESAENLESTNYGPLNGLEQFYMGPGIQLRADGHLYLRLQYNPNDLSDPSGNLLAPTPIDTNPNNHRIAIFFSSYIFRLDGASYVHFRDLVFSHAEYIFDVRAGSDHNVLSGSQLNYGSRGLVIRDNVRDWEIYNCEFNNGVPDYIYWTDVKNRGEDVAEAYPEFQSVAISGSLPGFLVHDNYFRDTFDGLSLQDGTTDARISDNVFARIRDDSINLSRGISEVEVAHNLLWHVMSGISNLGSDAAPGDVYIHHNVIDNSAYQRGGRPGNVREDNWPIWTIGSPFPDHDDGNKASWWKLYNNTIVTRQNVGHPWAPAGPDSVTGNPEKYVFNNIFYMLDEGVIYRDDLISSGSHYDGNVVFRNFGESLPLFANFGDGGGYDSLSDFQANSGTGWEAQGLEIDPGYDLSALAETNLDPFMVWEHYRPVNSLIFTAGASYEGLDWPEIQGVTYRGAIPPP